MLRYWLPSTAAGKILPLVQGTNRAVPQASILRRRFLFLTHIRILYQWISDEELRPVAPSVRTEVQMNNSGKLAVAAVMFSGIFLASDSSDATDGSEGQTGSSGNVAVIGDSQYGTLGRR